MRRAGAVLLLVCVCLLPALDAVGVGNESPRGELSTLRGKIRALQDEIARGEEDQDEVANDLANSDKAISQAQGRLKAIGLERRRAEDEMQGLLGRRAEQEAALAAHRRQLGEAIFRSYVEGGHAGARRFLSDTDPNQLARDAHYLELIAQQRKTAIDAARAVVAELQALTDAVDAHRSNLLKLEAERRHEQETLLAERKKQQDLLTRISSRLRDQKQVMHTLQRDEGRLEKLLRGLEQIARARARVQKPKLSPPLAGPANSAVSSSPSSTEVLPPRRPEPVPPPASQNAGFGSMKGQLHWPVRGELVGRFGSLRPESGGVWRGVFIRSEVGADVKAVAAGTVAFADWLRGFGNLVIVDHGDGYMTVYGNNETVFKNPGEGVKAGETIASVGAGGGLDESGLYFEVRFRGQPQDPSKWVAAR